MKGSTLNPHRILYQDNDLLIVNKPGSIPVHGSRILEGQPDTLLRAVREKIGKLVFVVHRLDRPVSGVMLMALNHESQARLGHQFEQRAVKKCYIAVVRGWTEAKGLVSHALMPAREDRKKESVARSAVTGFERIARIELPLPVHPYPSSRYSLLALYPETGRRHQLRRHMKHISHHIIGDTSYGRGEHNRSFRENFNCQRLLLHSWSLEVRHPVSEQCLRFHAPLGPAFNAIIEKFEWVEPLHSWWLRVEKSASRHN
jgi:tRNA pseudouridine65 synthase